MVPWRFLLLGHQLDVPPDFWAYYRSFPWGTLLPVFLFGAMWCVGNINYGLTMRYLGMSMGIGIAIGITLIVGTLLTPLLQGKFGVLLNTTGGRITLVGVLVAVVGVGIVSYAGLLKERAQGVRAEEFNLKKGLLLAIVCGFFSAGMSFAMDAAVPMHEAAKNAGISPLYVTQPSYVVIMGGGAIVMLYPARYAPGNIPEGRSLGREIAADSQCAVFNSRRRHVVSAILFLRLGSCQYSIPVRVR